MASFNFVDLFAGIGGTRIAFERQGGNCVYTCEKADEAREAYMRHFGDGVEGKDIKDVDTSEIPDHDVLLACWPCPSFSRIGDREGLRDDRGSLFYHILKVLEEKQPTVFFLENVKDVKMMDDGKIFEAITSALRELGYSLDDEVLNALDFGLPQNRERLMIVGTRTDDEISLPSRSSAALETESAQRAELDKLLVQDPPEKFVTSHKIQSDRQESVNTSGDTPSPSVWYENRAGQITLRPYANALRASASWNYQLVDGYRRFIPREMLRLQGFPEDFEITKTNESRARRITGNSIPVPMVEAVAGELLANVSSLPSPEYRPGARFIASD